jgi:UDP-N-acetylglucosamine acyltransferase
MTSLIHSTAIIDPSASLHPTVIVGAYSIIGPKVSIDEGTVIGPHVMIVKNTRIGKFNKIYQFSSIGEDPQDLHYNNEESFLDIGDRNTIREYVSINRGTAKQELITKIGNDNLFMAYVHIAHDCIVGNNVILANGATLAGHIQIEDYVNISAFCAIHQFCYIGAYSYISRGAMVTKDVLPYLMVCGNDPKTYGLNKVGLERRGFSKETLSGLQQAYKVIFREATTMEEASKELEKMVKTCPEVKLFLEGIARASRGIIR